MFLKNQKIFKTTQNRFKAKKIFRQQVICLRGKTQNLTPLRFKMRHLKTNASSGMKVYLINVPFFSLASRLVF